jgi:hypothetical protein
VRPRASSRVVVGVPDRPSSDPRRRRRRARVLAVSRSGARAGSVARVSRSRSLERASRGDGATIDGRATTIARGVGEKVHFLRRNRVETETPYD